MTLSEVEIVAQLRDLTVGPHAFFAIVARGPGAIPAVESVLRGPPESIYQHRCLAADALAAIGGLPALDALLRALDDCAGRIEEPVLADAEAAVVNRIAHHLGQLGGERAIEPLLRALERRVYPDAIAALGHLRDPRAVPVVVSALGHDVAREAAIEAVRAFGRVAVPQLQRLLVSSARTPSAIDGRVAAAALLGDLADDDLALPLLWCMDDPEPRIARAAAIALAARGASAAPIVARVLAQALDDDAWTSAEAAMEALAQLGPDASSALFAVIDRQSVRAATRAVAVLGRIGGAESMERLAASESSQRLDVRLAAVRALSGMVGAPALAVLQAFTRDPDPRVRLRTVEAMRARHALSADVAIASLDDSDRHVRALVHRALVELGRDAEPRLRDVVAGRAGAIGWRGRVRAWRVLRRVAR